MLLIDSTPQWDTANAEVRSPLLRVQSYQRFSLLSLGSRSEYGFGCFACCQEFRLSNFWLPGAFSFIFRGRFQRWGAACLQLWLGPLLVAWRLVFLPCMIWLSSLTEYQVITKNYGFLSRRYLPCSVKVSLCCHLGAWHARPVLSLSLSPSFSPSFSLSLSPSLSPPPLSPLTVWRIHIQSVCPIAI